MNKNNNNINIHIGQVIHTYRKLQKLTLSELAEQMGLSYQQLQKYEKGTNKISADKIFRLSQILKINPVEFFPGHTQVLAKQDKEQQEISFLISSLEDRVLKSNLLGFLERMHSLYLKEEINYNN